jgi:hypothetical protein
MITTILHDRGIAAYGGTTADGVRGNWLLAEQMRRRR